MSDLYQRAVRLLARREHSRAELARKLAAHGPQDEIETVLNQLSQAGLQSDTRFAENFVRAQSMRLGATRLRLALRNKGIESSLIADQVAELPDELERARAAWQRKFSSTPESRQEWARQARFLQGRGFSTEVICRLLKEVLE